MSAADAWKVIVLLLQKHSRVKPGQAAKLTHPSNTKIIGLLKPSATTPAVLRQRTTDGQPSKVMNGCTFCQRREKVHKLKRLEENQEPAKHRFSVTQHTETRMQLPCRVYQQLMRELLRMIAVYYHNAPFLLDLHVTIEDSHCASRSTGRRMLRRLLAQY